jgi:hypothetical protein
MSTNNPVRLVHSDIMPDCTLSSNLSVDTSLDYLANQYRSQTCLWPSVNGPMDIAGSNPENMVADSLSLIRHNINGLATMALVLYDDENLTGNQVYSSGFMRVSEQEPLGVWRFGVDPFGTSAFIGDPFTIWMDEPVIFKSWRLLFIWDSYAGLGDIEINSIFFGMTTKLGESMNWGSTLSTLRQAEGTYTGSGGFELLNDQLAGKVLKFDLAQMNDTDARKMMDFQSKVRGKHFFVSAYPESGAVWQDKATSFLGRLENPIEFARQYFDWQSANNIIISEV